MRYFSALFLLFYVGCASAPVSLEGRLTRIGIAIDASVNNIVDATETLYRTERINREERTKILEIAKEVTIKQQELIPVLRKLDTVPDGNSKAKAVELLQEILTTLNRVYDVGDANATAELIQKVGEVYQLATELIGEFR